MGAQAAMLRVEFHLPGCRSLKEKRRRLTGARTRLGRLTNLAICESDHQDAHQRAEWSLVAIGAHAGLVDQGLAEAERLLQTSVDARLIAVERTWLC